MQKDSSVESVFDRFVFIFGAGVGSQDPDINIDLSVLQALRKDYYIPILTVPSSKRREQKEMLERAREFGRICAGLAIEKHARSIDLDIFGEALERDHVCPCGKRD